MYPINRQFQILLDSDIKGEIPFLLFLSKSDYHYLTKPKYKSKIVKSPNMYLLYYDYISQFSKANFFSQIIFLIISYHLKTYLKKCQGDTELEGGGLYGN